jgi:hypothetical protein
MPLISEWHWRGRMRNASADGLPGQRSCGKDPSETMDLSRTQACQVGFNAFPARSLLRMVGFPASLRALKQGRLELRCRPRSRG